MYSTLQRFEQLGSVSPLMAAKFISKTHRFFQQFSTSLPVSKKYLWQKFVKKQYGFLKRRICCWLGVCWKSYKKLMRKKVINELVAEKLSFSLLLLCAKVFGAYNFLGWIFYTCYSTSASNFAFYNTHIEFVGEICFAYISYEAKIGRKASKNEVIFHKGVLESRITSISGLGGSI